MEFIIIRTRYMLQKLNSQKPSIICSRFKLSDNGAAMLEDGVNSAQYLNSLIYQEFYSDAVNFLAHGLPKREAIWWGYLAAKHADGESLANEAQEALRLIKDWVYHPDESLRRKAERLSEKLEFKTAVGWSIMSVFWSGGSLCAEHLPAVMPQEFLYAKGVAGAVMLAAVLAGVEQKREPLGKTISSNYRYFIEQGIDIAKGGNGENI